MWLLRFNSPLQAPAAYVTDIGTVFGVDINLMNSHMVLHAYCKPTHFVRRLTNFTPLCWCGPIGMKSASEFAIIKLHKISQNMCLRFMVWKLYTVLNIMIEIQWDREYPRGVMVKSMDCGIVVSEFVLQSDYYVHFRANTPRKRYESPYPPSYGLNCTTTVLLGKWLWH